MSAVPGPGSIAHNIAHVTLEWKRAVSLGSVEELERLLAGGADIDARDGHGQTALMVAAAKGHEHVVAWLVERGAALNVTAKFGLSALMLAVVNGRIDIVRRLTAAGADRHLRGSGAPGFAGKTALDLALARDDREMAGILRAGSVEQGSTTNSHFETAASWQAARALLSFQPLEPSNTGGLELVALRIHVRDHKNRELRVEDRTLEAHYGGFVLSQAWKGTSEARRLALAVPYGQGAQEARILGREARVYEPGPDVPPDDIDGRSPAVVTWCDGEMFYLIASGELATDLLLEIATSMYAR